MQTVMYQVTESMTAVRKPGPAPHNFSRSAHGAAHRGDLSHIGAEKTPPPGTFRTKTCRHFLTGRCSWGDDCRFAHHGTTTTQPPLVAAPNPKNTAKNQVGHAQIATADQRVAAPLAVAGTTVRVGLPSYLVNAAAAKQSPASEPQRHDEPSRVRATPPAPLAPLPPFPSVPAVSTTPTSGVPPISPGAVPKSPGSRYSHNPYALLSPAASASTPPQSGAYSPATHTTRGAAGLDSSFTSFTLVAA